MIFAYIFHSREMTAMKYSFQLCCETKRLPSHNLTVSPCFRQVTYTFKTYVAIAYTALAKQSLLLLSCCDERQFVAV